MTCACEVTVRHKRTRISQVFPIFVVHDPQTAFFIAENQVQSNIPCYQSSNMASNSHKRQERPHAQVTTPPNGPNHGCSPKHAGNHKQPMVTKIRELLSDMRGNPGLPSDSHAARSFEVQLESLMTATPDEKSSDTAVNTSNLQLVTTRAAPNTPCHNDSEPVTIR